jgi:hypothetical protein
MRVASGRIAVTLISVNEIEKDLFVVLVPVEEEVCVSRLDSMRSAQAQRESGCKLKAMCQPP